MSDGLVNPYPPELGNYRIGTPINADLNRADPLSPAFEMPLLEREHCLVTDANPTSTQRIQASGFDTRSQDAWGFSVDSAIKLNCFVSTALSSHIHRSWNVAHSRSGQTVTAYAKQESAIELRHNVSGEVLLRCATSDFLERLQAIRSALTSTASGAERQQAMLDAYRRFYQTYGTGFVSKLVLGAIGVFRGAARYESDFDETKANYGGGVSVSGITGGASVAAEYTSKTMHSNAKGTFQAESFGMPAGSGPAKWAEGFLNQFAGKQLADIGKLEGWQASFDTTLASAGKPEIKAREAVAPPKVPSFAAGKIDDQIKDLKLHEYVEAWKKAHAGQTPDAGQYRQWVSSLKETAANANAADIAKAKLELPDPVKAHQEQPEPAVSGTMVGGIVGGIVGGVMLSSAGATALLEAPPLRARAAKTTRGPVGARSVLYGARGEAFDDVNFNGYSVVGYDYTPWERVFPELKPITQEITASQVSMGIVMAWLSIRELFAQYIRFCARHFPDVAPEGASAAANAFSAALTDVSDQLLAMCSGAASEIVSLPALEDRFRQRLAAHRFTLMDHYQLLIDNYEWLRKVPFGAVPIVEFRNKHHYQPYTTVLNQAKTQPIYQAAWIESLQSPAATLLEKGALRLYPIMSTDSNKRPFFFWTNVEIVTLADRDYRVGASMLNHAEWGLIPGGRVPKMAWGMCRVRGETFTPGMLLRLQGEDRRTPRHVPHVRIVADDLDGPVWRLQRDTEYPAQGPLGMVFLKDSVPHELPNGLRGLLDATRDEDLRFMLGGMNTPAVFTVVPWREVRLVPIGYEDANIATEPEGGFVGGAPMWFESRTDQIVNALHALAG